MTLILDIVLGVVIFVVLLGVLAFTTSLFAEMIGKFRLLFLTKPYRVMFRAARWAVAALAAALVVVAIE